MLLGLGGPRPTMTVLGAAGALGAILWGVPLLLLAPGIQSAASGWLAILFLPSFLGTLALTFNCGLWFGRRRCALQDSEALAAGQSRIALAQTQLLRTTERLQAEERRITRLLEAAAPGAALLDAGHRLVAWSRGFPDLLDVPEAALQSGLPLSELVRLQPAGEGRQLPLRSIQAGIAGAVRRRGRDGSVVEDRWSPGADGEILLTCSPVAAAPQNAAPLSAGDLAALCEEEVRSRLPRLEAAIAAGDVATARMEAHAVRGVAAGFGLDALAAALGTVEMAARAGDPATLLAAGHGLPQLAEEALRHLARQVA